jgi:hypothetical protein
MKKLTLLFLGVSLFIHHGQGSALAQRTQSPARVPGIDVSQTRSQGRSNTGIENANRGAANTERDAMQAGKDVKVASAIERNPQLSSRLAKLLPEGMTMTDAAAGFKSQGQFIAALRVSENLGISFHELKMRMVAEDDRMSLGEAIFDIRGAEMTESQVKVEVNKAEREARTLENQAKAEARQAQERAKGKS